LMKSPSSGTCPPGSTSTSANTPRDRGELRNSGEAGFESQSRAAEDSPHGPPVPRPAPPGGCTRSRARDLTAGADAAHSERSHGEPHCRGLLSCVDD
jgi:hypothetical protein